MRTLIDDILELSAIEAGTVEGRAAARRALARSSRRRLRALAVAGRGLRRLALHEVSPGAIVYADPRRLEQMLLNLVDNAIKFSRRGGVVRSATRRGSATGQRHRHGRGHPGRAPAAHLRALLPRRPRALARAGRHGPRPRHRQAPRARARRRGRASAPSPERARPSPSSYRENDCPKRLRRDGAHRTYCVAGIREDQPLPPSFRPNSSAGRGLLKR